MDARSRRAMTLAALLCAPTTPPAAAQDWTHALLGGEAAASGSFVCESSVDGHRWSGTCFHPSLRALRDVETATAGGAGFAARVCRQLEARGYVAPGGAVEVSASGAVRDGQAVPDSATVYVHLYFPFATEASLGVTDTDPGGGAPWLHHAGTCTAHVMWSQPRALR